MKKNKTVAYMLAAALLVGGTFAGTKALFQDTETVNNPLILKTGNVDIYAEGSHWTMVDTNGNETPDDKHTNTFENVEPGYIFKKKITVQNLGTYKAQLGINTDDTIPEDIKDIIEVSHQGNVDGKVLNPGTGQASIDLQIKIKNSPDAWKKLNAVGQYDLDSLYTITATQVK